MAPYCNIATRLRSQRRLVLAAVLLVAAPLVTALAALPWWSNPAPIAACRGH